MVIITKRYIHTAIKQFKHSGTDGPTGRADLRKVGDLGSNQRGLAKTTDYLVYSNLRGLAKITDYLVYSNLRGLARITDYLVHWNTGETLCHHLVTCLFFIF